MIGRPINDVWKVLYKYTLQVPNKILDGPDHFSYLYSVPDLMDKNAPFCSVFIPRCVLEEYLVLVGEGPMTQ